VSGILTAMEHEVKTHLMVAARFSTDEIGEVKILFRVSHLSHQKLLKKGGDSQKKQRRGRQYGTKGFDKNIEQSCVARLATEFPLSSVHLM